VSVYLVAVILGLVEGATEFIPVSSTGHLILAGHWLGFEGARARTFEVFIQLGAILAIVWLYRRLIADVLRRAGRPGDARNLVTGLMIAFLPVALIGLFLHGWIKLHLFDPMIVAVALVVGGVGILAIEQWSPRTTTGDVERIPRATALGVGLAQVLSLIPGTSRSAATILGGYSLGLSRKAATEFSFLLAIPVMLAATLFDLVKSRHELVASDAPVFAIGFLMAFVSALVVVGAFLRFVSSHSFRAFAWYRIVFGLVLIVYFLGTRVP
jgi:undecaprenyl-diphosphatase